MRGRGGGVEKGGGGRGSRGRGKGKGEWGGEEAGDGGGGKRRKGEGRRNRGGEDFFPSSSGSWLQSPDSPWKERSPRFLFHSPSCKRRCTVQSWYHRARRTPCSLQGGGVCSPSPSTDAAVPGSASQAQRCRGAPGRRAVLPSDHWGFLPLSATGSYIPRSSLGPGPGPLNLISIHGFNYQTNTTTSTISLCGLLAPPVCAGTPPACAPATFQC